MNVVRYQVCFGMEEPWTETSVYYVASRVPTFACESTHGHSTRYQAGDKSLELHVKHPVSLSAKQSSYRTIGARHDPIRSLRASEILRQQPEMPEQLKPASLQQSHAQNLREDALRRLSRSPHPYHRQQFELPYGSERFNANLNGVTPPTKSPLPSTQVTDDERPAGPRRLSENYKESTNSDSGTEADDEHFLKGLPAPKLRPHKGLRGSNSPSGSPSPLLSPAILDDDSSRSQGFLRQKIIQPIPLNEEDIRKAAEKFRRKRRSEIVRRSIETGILFFVGLILCLDSQVRNVIYLWRRGLFPFITGLKWC